MSPSPMVSLTNRSRAAAGPVVETLDEHGEVPTSAGSRRTSSTSLRRRGRRSPATAVRGRHLRPWHAHHHHRAGVVTGVERIPRNAPVRRPRMNGDIRAEAAGERADRLDRVGAPRVDHVSGAELPGALELPVVHVDADDRGGPGQARAGDGRVADAAAAEHRSQSPRPTLPVIIAAPSPAMTPHPSRPAGPGEARSARPACTDQRRRASSRRTPDAQRGRERRTVRERHRLRRVVGVEAQHAAARARQGRHSPHTARQLRMTKSPGATLGHAVADPLTTPASSWPSRNGKSSSMPPSR